MNRKILQEFGLTANEAEIFAALLGGGAQSATELAKLLGLNRPYIYYALERLLEKGYLSEINEGGKRKFNAISPSQLMSLEEHKLDSLKKFVLELEKTKEKKEETSVEVYKGKQVVKNLFKRLLSEMEPKQETLSIGFDEHVMESAEPINIRKVFNFMKENRITERALVRRGSKTLEYAKTTQYRFLAPELVGNTAKYIYQDVVVYIVYGEPLYGIAVKNRAMADTERKQFELFWKAAEKR
ncbi:HTH-type transcriptional regulator TrmBL2 [uncultured archaeon]|nr:HTH-type transcriptional regulator TrmBL2 [uncultured archaeon]